MSSKHCSSTHYKETHFECLNLQHILVTTRFHLVTALVVQLTTMNQEVP